MNIPPINKSKPKSDDPISGGRATVISNKDRLRQGRVRLHFGSWATPMGFVEAGSKSAEYEIPEVGEKVKYFAFAGGRFVYIAATKVA